MKSILGILIAVAALLLVYAIMENRSSSDLATTPPSPERTIVPGATLLPPSTPKPVAEPPLGVSGGLVAEIRPDNRPSSTAPKTVAMTDARVTKDPSPTIDTGQSTNPVQEAAMGSGTAAVSGMSAILPAAQESFSFVPGSSGIDPGVSPDGTSPRNPMPLAQSGQSSSRELNLPVPLGAKVPAAVVDVTPDYTPQQTQALESIIGDFEKEIAEGASQGLTETQAWEAARMRADNRYRVLFGDAAYNMMSMQAAIEALEEKKSIQ